MLQERAGNGSQRGLSCAQGAVCADSLCWPSWDGLETFPCSFSLSWQSSPYCWASDTEKPSVKFHSILNNFLCLSFLTCTPLRPFLPHLFSNKYQKLVEIFLLLTDEQLVDPSVQNSKEFMLLLLVPCQYVCLDISFFHVPFPSSQLNM